MKRRNPYPVGNMMQSNLHSFGMLMKERTFSSGDYRFGFNGKEKTDEINGSGNNYDTKYRMLDVRLARWFSVDPKSHALELIGLSPFEFCVNDPILFIDPEGSIPFPKTVDHVRVSSEFGYRISPLTNKPEGHPGMDLATDGTGHDVRAFAGGKVVAVGLDPGGYGRYVVIQHPNGYYSLYGHLETDGVVVKMNQDVADGETIGSSGNTGGSTGPHLHLTVAKGTAWTDVFDHKKLLNPREVGDLEELATGKSSEIKVDIKVDFHTKDNTIPVYNVFVKPVLFKVNSNTGKTQSLMYTVSANALNLRSGAGTNYSTNGQALSSGAKLTATGKKSDDWVEVKTEDDRTGWVNKDYIKPK